jgi:hypothetical protein
MLVFHSAGRPEDLGAVAAAAEDAEGVAVGEAGVAVLASSYAV